MIRNRRNLCLLIALALAAPASAGDLQDAFERGVQLLKEGQREDALVQFQRALAGDPSNDEVYELWKTTDHEMWLSMMIEGGEFELIAQRLMERATLGQKARQNDEGAIKELVDTLRSTDDAIVRRTTVRTLSAEHGEYAVPYLLPGLANQDDADWNVTAMVALSQMDSHVVLPLTEALRSDDVFLRTNVAHVLRRIGDPRAAAALAEVLETDEDGGVTKAAADALKACGAAGRSAVELYIESANAYYAKDGSVLREFDYSEVVWDWADGELVARPVPKAFYAEELARVRFARALALSVDSLEAMAGLARTSTAIQAKFDFLNAMGEDVSGLEDQVAEGSLIVAAAGADALDAALQASVNDGDVPAGVELCRALALSATAPTTGLQSALTSGEGPSSGEAAVALGTIAARNGIDAGAQVVDTLSKSAGREIALLAAVIDANAGRLEEVLLGLEAKRAATVARENGASGLTMLRQLPGVDMILVGDGLPDLTLDKVLSAIAADPKTAETPVFLVTASQTTGDLFESRVAGVVNDASDLSALEEVLTQDLEGDRAEANALAQASAATLAALAHSGATDISSSLDVLAGTLSNRPDGVILPAMDVLGLQGGGEHVTALMGVLAGSHHSEAARTAAASALAGILGRASVDSSVAAELRGIVVDGGAPLAVRQAAARALARASLTSEDRASLVEEVRVPLSNE